MRKVEILRLDASTGEAQRIADYVAEEKPLNIFVNKTRYATIFCSPSNLKELAVGHVLSQGIISSIEEIEETNLNQTENCCRIKLKRDVDLRKRLNLSASLSRVLLSACTDKTLPQSLKKMSKIESDLKVKAETILSSVNNLNLKAETFKKTGGVHAASIHKEDGSIVAFAEDVGRHNAVDKAIGAAILDRVSFSECFLALSGRLTGDLVLKAVNVGFPIVASLAAATDLGIKLAETADLTLVGFVRGGRMNVYSFPERIIV
jgi:FdhD protein